jgi:hypothetical protein
MKHMVNLEILSTSIESRVSKKYLHTYVHSTIIHSYQKAEQIKCPSTNEWISKMWEFYTVNYHSALKGKEILKHAVT